MDLTLIFFSGKMEFDVDFNIKPCYTFFQKEHEPNEIWTENKKP
jgi:hypothetical protein